MAGPKPTQILQLTPAHEITFEGPFTDVVTSYLEIKNPSEDRVCFKVKTTAPRRYCVRPNSGIVEPGKNVKIAIMLQPIEEDSQTERNKHKFMVQSTIIRDDKSVDTVWQSAAPEDIMDSKLRCIFLSSKPSQTTAASAPSTPPVSNEAAPTKPSTPANTTNSATPNPIQKQIEQLKKPVGDVSPRPNESDPFKSSGTQFRSLGVSTSGKAETSDLAVNKSIASSHNLTASFLQPMSDDYKIVLVSLAMLFIGVILGKYVI